MKKLRKINLGLVLTILVVAAVVIYSVALETSRSQDKGEIKTTVEEFTKLVSEKVVLEEKEQVYNNTVDDELEKFVNENVKPSLKAAMIDNDAAINIEATQIQNDFENQINTATYKTKVEQELTKISSFVFDGDQVTVTFNRKVTENIKYFDVEDDGISEKNITSDSIKEKTNTYNTNSEIITLKKVDGKWKVVYANLQLTATPANLGPLVVTL